MAYKPLYHRSIEKALGKIRKRQARRIITAVRERICNEPRSGKALKGRYKGLWSYRVGSFRIIYSIDDEESSVRILKIGERQSVYDDLLF